MLVAVGLLPKLKVNAQSYAESALIFSRTIPGGSARMQAIGGAQVSLGGDYSSASSNPAGLGMYNRNEFAITPAFNMAGSSADYLGGKTSADQSNLYLPGIAMSFHNDFGQTKGLLGGTFTVSFNRLNDFNRNIQYAGVNPNNSITNYFIEQANGATADQFSSGGNMFNTPTELAWDNYVIGDMTVLDPNGDPKQYFTDAKGNPSQAETIKTNGAQNQWSLSYGVNVNDRFFIGAGLGLTSLRYKSKKTYTEAYPQGALFDLSLEENLQTKGSGINGTIGAIYRPIDIVQFGFSYTTPTHYGLSDTYTATMSTNWDNFQYDPSTVLNHESASTDALTANYTLNTPGKISLGATAFVGKSGFISADIEKINYTGAKYKSGLDAIDFSGDNKEIRSLYQSVYNLRVGGEFRLKSFRFRGGYSYMPDPYTTQQNGVSQSIQSISGGVGYRTKSYFVDLAVIHRQGQSSYRPYTINSVTSPVVSNSLSGTSVMVTLGFPF